MKLTGFRVTNFRSVEDSGWIETDNVTALIGTNESGKTNLLMPLWKLKPAKDGQINPIADYPRKRYNEIRSMDKKPVFIEAQFELGDELVEQVAEMTGATADDVRVARVKRDLGGGYIVAFPSATLTRHMPTAEVVKMLSDAGSEIEGLTAAGKADEDLKTAIASAISDSTALLKEQGENVYAGILKSVAGKLNAVSTEKAPKRSVISPRYGQLTDVVGELIEQVSRKPPSESEEARKLIVKSMPSFVYYSNYGNLDSEIYLPHVIENLTRKDLGSKEEAKARTLKVLFEFVRLKPQEILELGQDFRKDQGKPSPEQIKEIAEKKKERDVLLQSAGTELTQKFRAWWKQGDYRFRFQADGDHFRIWVSDDVRPEDIELEGRSTGLQWFLSFYLIFLVESANAHADSILLLDEPGLSLHPLAQRDLSEFFENLAQTNQIAYTTHSPFMVDPDHLDRVKAVYVDDDGLTVASSNLRAREDNSSQSKSIYAVYAALGLSVSDTLFLGCQAVIVEGQSDQIYLSAIKNYLIGRGLISPKRELLFPPAGGVKGVRAVVSILTGKDEALPHVMLDSDAAGQTLAKQLANNIYAADPERIIMIGDVCGIADAEIEDLLPQSLVADTITRYLRSPSEYFSDVVVSGQPIIPQTEAFAAKHGLTLPAGWKVEIARQIKGRLLKNPGIMDKEQGTIELWKTLFEKLEI